MNRSLKNSVTVLALFLLAVKFYPSAIVVSFLWMLYLLISGVWNHWRSSDVKEEW